MRLIAFLTDPSSIRDLLSYLGESLLLPIEFLLQRSTPLYAASSVDRSACLRVRGCLDCLFLHDVASPDVRWRK